MIIIKTNNRDQYSEWDAKFVDPSREALHIPLGDPFSEMHVYDTEVISIPTIIFVDPEDGPEGETVIRYHMVSGGNLNMEDTYAISPLDGDVYINPEIEFESANSAGNADITPDGSAIFIEDDDKTIFLFTHTSLFKPERSWVVMLNAVRRSIADDEFTDRMKFEMVLLGYDYFPKFMSKEIDNFTLYITMMRLHGDLHQAFHDLYFDQMQSDVNEQSKS